MIASKSQIKVSQNNQKAKFLESNTYFINVFALYISYIWYMIYHSNQYSIFSEIRSKHSSHMVLTVAMPANEPFSEDEEGRPLTFSGCAVTLQARKLNMYGKAHQKWRYDAETGYIHAFFTNPYDKGKACIFSSVWHSCRRWRFLVFFHSIIELLFYSLNVDLSSLYSGT